MTLELNHNPCCPNHGVPLELTKDPGIGICPISRCEFQYEAEELEEDEVKDKFGSVTQGWKLTQVGGGNDG